MTQFSMGEAWSQTSAFIREHLRMLLIIVGGSIVVGTLLQLLVSDGAPAASQVDAMRAAMTSGDFTALVRAGAAGGGSVLAVPAVLFAGLIQSGGQFAALRLGLARSDESIGAAISYGLGAALLTSLFYIVVGMVAAIVVIVPVAVLGGASLFAGTAPGAGTIGALVVFGLVLLVALVWLSARLSVIVPAMAVVRSSNPLYGLSQSWTLTRGHAWPIVGYLLLLGIGAMILFAVLGGVAGAIGALFGPLGSQVLVALLVSIPVGIISLGVSAGLFLALAPSRVGDIFG